MSPISATAALLATVVGLACGKSGASSATEPSTLAAATGAGLSVLDYGARGDGVSPDTAAIQKAIDALPAGATLHFPSGVYRIETDKGLRLKDGARLDLGDATLVGPNVNGAQNRILEIQGASNVVISGGTLVGSRAGSPGLGLGIFASDAENLVIENVQLRDFYLDGILLTGNRGCRRVVVRDCVSQNNRRTGMAVVHASDVRVERSTFTGSRGQSPESGVNCEPNAGESVRNVHFVGCTFSGNAGVGLYVHRGQGVGNADVTVKDSVIEGNGYGIVASHLEGLLIQGNRVSSHPGKGRSGIVLGENTARASIVDNTLQDNHRGILTVEAAGLTIRGNTIVGLGATVGAGDDGHGIDCRGPQRSASAEPSVVAGNTVHSFPGSGLTTYLLSNLRLLDNVVEGTGRRGLHLRATSHSEVRGNDVSGTGLEAPGRYDGIELEQASSHNRIVANRIRRGAAMRNPIGITRDCVGNQVLDNLVLPD